MRSRGFGWSLCPGTASVPGSEDAGELLLLYLPVVVFFFFFTFGRPGQEEKSECLRPRHAVLLRRELLTQCHPVT